eukprot:GEMP01011491.1.p1 GENE.GEMP01011491.1~~GEMP01011491.1.p1  ORF type:complete len:463 (+),score=92.21 GEMP01011491.1:65-1453(+)
MFRCCSGCKRLGCEVRSWLDNLTSKEGVVWAKEDDGRYRECKEHGGPATWDGDWDIECEDDIHSDLETCGNFAFAVDHLRSEEIFPEDKLTLLYRMTTDSLDEVLKTGELWQTFSILSEQPRPLSFITKDAIDPTKETEAVLRVRETVPFEDWLGHCLSNGYLDEETLKKLKVEFTIFRGIKVEERRNSLTYTAPLDHILDSARDAFDALRRRFDGSSPDHHAKKEVGGKLALEWQQVQQFVERWEADMNAGLALLRFIWAVALQKAKVLVTDPPEWLVDWPADLSRMDVEEAIAINETYQRRIVQEIPTWHDAVTWHLQCFLDLEHLQMLAFRLARLAQMRGDIDMTLFWFAVGGKQWSFFSALVRTTLFNEHQYFRKLFESDLRTTEANRRKAIKNVYRFMGLGRNHFASALMILVGSMEDASQLIESRIRDKALLLFVRRLHDHVTAETATHEFFIKWD